MKVYLAAVNKFGASNTWDVLAFSSKKARDEYVGENDGYNIHSQRVHDCRAIGKRDVGKYLNRKPVPFSGECWIIHDQADPARDPVPGYVGDVFADYPSAYFHRLNE